YPKIRPPRHTVTGKTPYPSNRKVVGAGEQRLTPNWCLPKTRDTNKAGKARKDVAARVAVLGGALPVYSGPSANQASHRPTLSRTYRHTSEIHDPDRYTHRDKHLLSLEPER